MGRRGPAPAESNLAVHIDQIHGSLHERPVGVIQLGDSLSPVHQQRKRQLLFLPKTRMAVRALRVDAVHLNVLRFQPIPIVAHLAELLSTTGSVVARIKHQNDILPAQRCQRYILSRIVGHREVRRRRAHRQRIGKEPSEHQGAPVLTNTDAPDAPSTLADSVWPASQSKLTWPSEFDVASSAVPSAPEACTRTPG